MNPMINCEGVVLIGCRSRNMINCHASLCLGRLGFRPEEICMRRRAARDESGGMHLYFELIY